MISAGGACDQMSAAPATTQVLRRRADVPLIGSDVPPYWCGAERARVFQRALKTYLQSADLLAQ